MYWRQEGKGVEMMKIRYLGTDRFHVTYPISWANAHGQV